MQLIVARVVFCSAFAVWFRRLRQLTFYFVFHMVNRADISMARILQKYRDFKVGELFSSSCGKLVELHCQAILLNSRQQRITVMW